MIEPNETPVPGAKHLLPDEVTSNVALPQPVPHGGPTRKGHSNGLRVHAVVFVSLSLGVIVALAIVFVVVAGGKM